VLAKIISTLALLALPFTLTLWYKSHFRPEQHRFDLTLYRSVWVYSNNGVFGINILTLPTGAPSKSEFRTTMQSSVFVPLKKSFELSSTRKGKNRIMWIVFPLWLPNAVLAAICGLGLLYGPILRGWRRRHGCCADCGYDLRGLRSTRCPECGNSPARARKIVASRAMHP